MSRNAYQIAGSRSGRFSAIAQQGSLLNQYRYPSWWTGTRIAVRWTPTGAVHNYEITNNANVAALLATTHYYVSTTGNDGNGGLSEGDSLATVQGAINKGATHVRVLEGTYPDTSFVQNYYTNIAIVGVGTVLFTKAENSVFNIIPRNAPRNIYLENIEFGRGVSFVGTTTYSNLGSNGYLKNVRCLTPTSTDEANNTNGIETNSIPLILQDCVSSNANLDNFNYHNTFSVSDFECIEIDCVSADPSNCLAGGANQCTTAHDGTKMLRIGGDYTNGNSQVVADVGIGGQSVLLGCTLDQQKAISGGGNTVIQTADGECWHCNLLGDLATGLGVSAVDGTLTIKDSYSQHTTETGTIVEENVIHELYPQNNAVSALKEANDFGGWLGSDAGKWVVTDEVYHGDYSIKGQAADGTGDRLELRLDAGILEASTDYVMEIWIKQTVGSFGFIKSWNAAIITNITPSANIVSDGEWHEYTIEFTTTTAPDSFVGRFYVADGGAQNDIIYIDKVSLVKV